MPVHSNKHKPKSAHRDGSPSPKTRKPQQQQSSSEEEENQEKEKEKEIVATSQKEDFPPLREVKKGKRRMRASSDEEAQNPVSQAKRPKPRSEETSSTTDEVPAYVKCHVKAIRKVLEQQEDNHQALDSLDALEMLIQQLTIRNVRYESKFDVAFKMLVKEREINAKNESRPATYANVAQRIVAPKQQIKSVAIKSPQKVVMIKDKANKMSAESVKTELQKVFNPQKEGVRIKNVRKTRAGLLVETETEEDLKRLQASKSLKQTFDIRKPQKRKPRLLIYDIPKDMSITEMQRAIYTQNKGCAENLEQFQENFQPKFKTGKKDRDTTNWVAEVSPAIRCSLLKEKRIYIGWLACKVQDFLAVTKCYKCQGYGHIAKYCDKELTCSLCATTGHKNTECPKKKEKRRCVNCLRVKKDPNHDSNDKNCPCYKAALERMINATDYGR